jgi:hypothetical protein
MIVTQLSRFLSIYVRAPQGHSMIATVLTKINNQSGICG